MEINVTFAAEAVKTAFGNQAPILVGASLGGYTALKYASTHPVRGLFLIAPAHAFENDKLTATYRDFKFPVRIVWGSNDNIVSGEAMRRLTDILPNAKLLVYPGATHSAYKDEPERFKRDIIELYAIAE
jgi:pimeloyl-ACP methyl ester carboxylesterase